MNKQWLHRHRINVIELIQYAVNLDIVIVFPKKDIVSIKNGIIILIAEYYIDENYIWFLKIIKI